METWGNVYCLTGLILIIAGAINHSGWQVGPGAFFVVVGLLTQFFAFEPLEEEKWD